METINGKNTGLAQINVAENGENQIVIIPGANDLLSAADVEKAKNILDSSKVYYTYSYLRSRREQSLVYISNVNVFIQKKKKLIKR